MFFRSHAKNCSEKRMSSRLFCCSLAIISLLLLNALVPVSILLLFADALPPAASLFRPGVAYGPSLYSRGNFGGGGDVVGAVDKIAAPTPRNGGYGGSYGYAPPPSVIPYRPPVTYYGKPIPLPAWKDTSLSVSFGNGWGGYQPGFWRPVWEDDYNAVVQSIGSSYATIATSRNIYVPRAPPPVYGDLGALSQHPIISETVVRDVLKGTALGDFRLIETPAPTAATTPVPAVNATVAAVAAVPAEKAIALGTADIGVSTAAIPVAAPSAPAGVAVTIDSGSSAAAASSSVQLPAATGTPGGAIPDCSFTSSNPTACANPGTTGASLASPQTITVTNNKEGGGLTMSIADASAAQPPAAAASAYGQPPSSPTIPQMMTREDAAAAQPPSAPKVSSSYGSLSSSAAAPQPIITAKVISANELEPLDKPPEHPFRPHNAVVPTSSSSISKMSVQDAGTEPSVSANAGNKLYADANTAANTINNDVKLASSPQMNVIHIGSDSTLNMTELLHVLSSAKAAGQLNNVNEPTLTIVKQRGPVSSVLTVPTDELKLMSPFGGVGGDQTLKSTLSADAVPQQPAAHSISGTSPQSWANWLTNPANNVLTEQQAKELMNMSVKHPLFPGGGSAPAAPTAEETPATTTTTTSTAAVDSTSAGPYSYGESAPSPPAAAPANDIAVVNSAANSMLSQLNSNMPASSGSGGPTLVSIEFHPSNFSEPPSSAASSVSSAGNNANENAAASSSGGGGAKTIVENRNVFVPTLPPLSLPSSSQQDQQQQPTGDVRFVSGTDAGNAQLLSNTQASGASENSITLHHPSFPGAGAHFVDNGQSESAGNNNNTLIAREQLPLTTTMAPNDTTTLRLNESNQVLPKLNARLGLRPPGPVFFSQIDDPDAPPQQSSNKARTSLSWMTPSNTEEFQAEQQDQKPFVPSPQVAWPNTRFQSTTTTTTAKPEQHELSVEVVSPTAPLRFGQSSTTTTEADQAAKINKWRKALFPPTHTKRDEQSRTSGRGLLTLDDFLQPLVAIKADRPTKNT